MTGQPGALGIMETRSGVGIERAAPANGPVGRDDGPPTSDGRRHAWGQAYRDGSLVCSRVHVTFGDDRVGPAPRERRTVAARFGDRVHPALRAELADLAVRHGRAARQAAERIEPIVLMLGDPRHDRERIVARIVAPQARRGGMPIVDLRDVAFRLREVVVGA